MLVNRIALATPSYIFENNSFHKTVFTQEIVNKRPRRAMSNQKKHFYYGTNLHEGNELEFDKGPQNFTQIRKIGSLQF